MINIDLFTADRAMYKLQIGENVTLSLQTDAAGAAQSKSVQFLTDIGNQVSSDVKPWFKQYFI